MANTSAPRSPVRYTGWFKNDIDGTLDLYEGGVKVAAFSNTAATYTSPAALPQALTIGGIAYTFPADNGDAGEQLQTNGSGVLTWEASGV